MEPSLWILLRTREGSSVSVSTTTTANELKTCAVISGEDFVKYNAASSFDTTVNVARSERAETRSAGGEEVEKRTAGGLEAGGTSPGCWTGGELDASASRKWCGWVDVLMKEGQSP